MLTPQKSERQKSETKTFLGRKGGGGVEIRNAKPGMTVAFPS